MITPITFVKILRTEEPKGDRDTKRHKAWTVFVCRDEEQFTPMQGTNFFMAEAYVFDYEKAVTWARKVANIIKADSIQLWHRAAGVEVYELELYDAD